VAATSPVAADAPSTVIVTVIGTDGNPMSGVTVTLAEAGSGGNVVNPAQPTDSNGQTQGSFSASTPGNYTIQATAGGVIINQTASIVVQ
jgi:protocatechuate 3,4-dioxygenase beta subunit